MIPNMLNSTFSWYKANLNGNDLLTIKSTWPCCITVQAPSLFIYGAKDQYFNFNDHLGLLSAFFQKLETKEFKSNSHWILHESPKELSDTIKEFLRNL